jgi:threonylcarbamoyladenosine tRNA methylthiotransferase MtaB
MNILNEGRFLSGVNGMEISTPEKDGRPRRVAFFTRGCKVNQQETAALQELFRGRGYEIVGFDGPAEVYIINTCTVTHLADHKSRQMIRRAASGRFGRPLSAVTAAVGCYAQTAPEQVLPLGVDVLVGTQNRGRIVDLVEHAASLKAGEVASAALDKIEAAVDDGREILNAVSPLSASAGFEELPLPRPHNRTRAFLKIEDGCDQYCSYCIVPFARGPVRSLRPEMVRMRLEELLAAGFREVVLTGVHTSAYGRDLTGGVNLAFLLRLLLQVSGEFRLRLSSVEPAEVTDELLEVLASPRICRHLHLPLQSGDDEILALMGRPYRAADYRALFNRVQERLPGVAVAADVMVGFPGETDLHFENTYRFVADLPFRDMHVFKYSLRPGTRAAKMPGQVAPAAKDERSSRLRRLADEQAAAFAGRFISEMLPVMVERQAPARPGCPPGYPRKRPESTRRVSDGARCGYWEGLSDNYLKIVFPACPDSPDLQGRLVPVRVLEQLDGDTLYGEMAGIQTKRSEV